ncbi:complex I subunit 4 family protein [Flavisolibacter ginsengisoli]|jgi:NADH-quinone oxidoreductase subunit M|uniref:NADH-quinone oxidoreductase subunit M n=1 Tax=Flavisolibacter ginsengisoli DSM 18119 TaxID=1121884 RepID=A0A1M5ARM9_9BACT|nr:NADH-quinone oxidoreductase subunit M [Flavisolibacter ginsengisoli]SHF32757.1 NADH-quinone oxidoreductase subunit M [Flavisolibacter ginsengisoli DSM 18119]
MIVLLLFLVPLIGGFLSFFIKNDKTVRTWALLTSVITLLISIAGNTFAHSPGQLHFSSSWLGSLGSSFSLQLDGLSQILCLLTAISYPLILVSTWRSSYKTANNFFALMLLTQAGLMGVFLATDALLFYFFWELALVPMYFLCSGWGGERRIPVTFKFFIYTFTASVLMLIGLLYLYFQTPDRSFSLQSFYALKLSNDTQSWVFWLLFLAFAVKMPVFPFHTWQPDTYEQSPTAATMVLSAIMVKMGVYGVIRWVLPVVPIAAYSWGDVVMSLSVIGIIYASIIAIQQDDFKRLIAYSSIAHIGLMSATLFAETKIGYQGVMVQMFNHGINILGLWIIVELIERQFGTRKLSQLGGVAQKAPALAILFVILAFANISLPLTNAFIGEFLMFSGIWSSTVTHYNILFTVLAILSIILAAVYTLTAVQKVLYGPESSITEGTKDIHGNEKMVLWVIVIMVVVFGVYPQPLLRITDGFVDLLLNKINVAHLFVK